MEKKLVFVEIFHENGKLHQIGEFNEVFVKWRMEIFSTLK
jgi:hypothetical protein